MSERYPRVRVHSKYGGLLIRESLSFTFYMHHPHAEVAQSVLRSLDAYLRVIGGPGVLSVYLEEGGAWWSLDDSLWETTRRELLEPSGAHVHLVDETSGESRYKFEYHGKPLKVPSLFKLKEQEFVSAVSFWLPTEYLEEHGPHRIRELALELAAPLPFCSGHVGLAFDCDLGLVGISNEVRKWWWRYPGLDVPDLSRLAVRLGPRVRTVAWLTFLGPPVLGAVGGVEGLRSRLRSPDTTVEPLDVGRAVVTLGPWPEAGDTESGQGLPAYRELARVLEPWLYFEEPSEVAAHFELERQEWEELHRWERRFLD